jgi:hypothetical protein
MPKFKGDPPGPTEVTHIRVEKNVLERARKSQKEGVHADMSEGAFLGYLINIGINIYEKRILPLEIGDISPSETVKIMPKKQKSKMRNPA